MSVANNEVELLMAKVADTIDGFPPKVKTSPWVSNPSSNPGLDQSLLRLRKTYEQLARVVNGLLSFGDGTSRDNIDGNWITVTTPGTPNTDFIVNHNLNRIPVGYIVMSKNAACDIYTGSVAATATQLTLRATVGAVLLKLFIV